MNLKKIALGLCFSFLFSTAFAASASSGYCGGGYSEVTALEWTLSPEGSLKVFGNGCIGYNSFEGNTDIIRAHIASGAEKLSGESFKGCSNLTYIDLPETLTMLGREVFSGCTNLKGLVLGNSVDFFSADVLSGCTSLEYLYIPKSLPDFSDSYIKDCTALKTIYYQGSQKEFNELLKKSTGTSASGGTMFTDTHIKSLNLVFDTDDETKTALKNGIFDAPSAPLESDEISVILNGSKIAFDQPPVIDGGRTLVPLRAIFEALGASVDWNGDTQTVTATKEGVLVSLTIASTQMYVNDSVKTLDVPAQIINSRTLVPVRAISEAFGAGVNWNGDTQTVTITQ